MSQVESPSIVPTPFQFQDKPIRAQLQGDTLWFVARDVCDALNISWSGQTLSSLPQGWKGMISYINPQGNQRLRAITEPGVYKLAFRSNKPEADAFTNWIASEVIPSIRKTGKYEMPKPSTPADSLTLSTAESRKPLRALVHAWAQMARQPHSVAWAQVKGHFQLSRIDDMPEEWIPDALAFVQSRIDALPPAEQLALPQGQPMYRNGCFYIPSINDNHKAGPREEAFMELWRQWDGRVRAIKDLFNSLVRDIDHRRGDLFPHVISDLGRNADTAFSTDSLTEALYAAHTQAREDFDRSLDLLFRHMRTCLNLSVVMRM